MTYPLTHQHQTAGNAEVGLFIPPAEDASNRVINLLIEKIMEETPGINVVIFRVEQPTDDRTFSCEPLLKKQVVHSDILRDVVFPFLDEQSLEDIPQGTLLTPNLLTQKYPNRVRIVDVKNPNDRTFINDHITANQNLKMAISIRNLVVFKSQIIRAFEDKGSARFLNTHPGPLPEVRGLEAPFWSRVNGLTDYCTTLHTIAEEIDGGPILDYKAEAVNGGAKNPVSEYPRRAAPDTADMIYDAIHRYLVRNFKAPVLESQDNEIAEYFTLPTPNEIQEARSQGVNLTSGQRQMAYLLEAYSNRRQSPEHHAKLMDRIQEYYQILKATVLRPLRNHPSSEHGKALYQTFLEGENTKNEIKVGNPITGVVPQ